MDGFQNGFGVNIPQSADKIVIGVQKKDDTSKSQNRNESFGP